MSALARLVLLVMAAVLTTGAAAQTRYWFYDVQMSGAWSPKAVKTTGQTDGTRCDLFKLPTYNVDRNEPVPHKWSFSKATFHIITASSSDSLVLDFGEIPPSGLAPDGSTNVGSVIIKTSTGLSAKSCRRSSNYGEVIKCKTFDMAPRYFCDA